MPTRHRQRPTLDARRGLNLPLRRWAALLLALGLLTVAVSGATLSRAQQEALQSDQRVRQASQFLTTQQDLRIAMLNRKANLNQYLYSASPRFADAYEADGRTVLKLQAALETESPSSTTNTHLRSVAAAINVWESWASEVKKEVDQSGKPATSNPASQGASIFATYAAAAEILASDARSQLESSLNQAQRVDRDEQLVIAACAALLAAIVAILVVLLVWRVLRPIERLAEVSRRLAKGKDVTVPLRGRRDEVGELARALAGWQRTAEARQQAEWRVHTIVESAPFAIGTMELNGRYTGMNPAGLRIFNCRREQMTRLRRLDVSAPQDNGDDARLFEELVQGKRERYRTTKIYQRPDGSHFQGDVTVMLVRDAAGQPDFCYSIMDDVTQRREAEELSLRLGRILDGSSNEIYVIDANLRILEVNQTAAAHLGYTSEELQSLHLYDTVVGLDPLVARDSLAALDHKGTTEVVLEARHVRKDGSEYPVELRLQLSETSQPRVFVAIVQDITDRRQVAEARRESEAKSRFLAAMSHELRTPLNSVLGFAQLLAMQEVGALNPKQERYVSVIESSGKHLLALINGILDLARVASGHVTVRPEQLALATLINDAIERMRPMSDNKGLRLTVASDATLTVWADHQRLHQVILNLLSNAIKFTPVGGEISVEATALGEMARISVRDTGVGIPAEHLDTIFEEFTQVESGMVRSEEGTGLGLPLSRRLVELMAGTIQVESDVGHGSTFTVTLPQTGSRQEDRPTQRSKRLSVL
jgi:PAS domain S-box-containing protein